jgi:hypothetical protein
MIQDKYLVSYEGYVNSGPGAGFPERKHIVYHSLEQLVESGILDRQPDCNISFIKPVDKHFFDDLRIVRKRVLEKRAADERQKDKLEYERLKSKLGI